MKLKMFEEYIQEVVRPCADCGRIVTMKRIETRCEICESVEAEKIKPEEEKAMCAETLGRWKRQGIPTRFFDFDLKNEYDYAVKTSVIIFGEIGTGKSCLAAQIMKHTGGKYISAAAMMDEIQDDNNRMWDYKEKNSLCLDDFTKINPTGYRLEKLFEIFNERYANDKHTVITCDTLAGEVKQAWGNPGKAIVSRIGEWMQKIHLRVKYR